MVAPLTEMISRAALKLQRNRKTAEHGGIVLVAQRSQIVCHGQSVTYLGRAMSLLNRYDGTSVPADNGHVAAPRAHLFFAGATSFLGLVLLLCSAATDTWHCGAIVCRKRITSCGESSGRCKCAAMPLFKMRSNGANGEWQR
jgi:hypothetical protein